MKALYNEIAHYSNWISYEHQLQFLRRFHVVHREIWNGMDKIRNF